MTQQPSSAEIRLRILLGEDIAMGPGKADLLESIRDLGSISAASRALGMSYPRAWLLVDTMNRCFPEPLVLARKGGTHRGGAQVTPFGLEVLAAYRRALQRASEGAAAEVEAFQARYLRRRGRTR